MVERLILSQDVVGSRPTPSAIYVEVAQLVERLIEDQRVTGSNPVFGTKL